MELKKLIKNTSFLISTRIVQFFVGLIRSKINALLIGTIGIGIVNQLTFITQKMAQFTMLSMSEAVVKQIAGNTDKDNIKDIVKSSLKSYIILVLSFLLISFSLFIALSGTLTSKVFGDLKYLTIFYIGVFSFPLLLLNSIPFAILKGFKDVRSISRSRIIIIISNLVIFLPLILVFKLEGAIAFVPVSYLITLGSNYLFTRKYHLLRLNINLVDIIKVPITTKFVTELLLFSGVGLTIGTYGIVSEFVCRSIVVSNLGVEMIGVYSPILTFAGLFTGFLLPTFTTYLYPRFCETKSNIETSGILNDALRLGTLSLFPLLFIGIPYRNIFIKVIYTKDFLEAGKYLPYHFIGLIFYVWWYVFTQAMTPTGKIRQHAVMYTMYMTLDIAVTWIFVPRFGLGGWMLKFLISPFLFFILYYLYLKKTVQFNFLKSNIIIMTYLFCGSFGMIFIENILNKESKINFVIGPLLLLAGFFLLQKNEKMFLLQKAQYLFHKKFTKN